MDVNPITTTTPPSAASATSGTSAASATLMDNYSSFLTLLTAQLTHQDPTQPMDSAQFTQQLVQFSSVEQSIATNKNLQQLISLSQSTQNASVVGYIGKTVLADGQTATLSGGQASWDYTIPSNAAQVTLTMTDSNGKTIYSQAGDASAGSHTVVWDGTTTGGGKAADGDYQLNVTALDSSGNAVATSTAITGVVSGVETLSGQSRLIVGSHRVPLSSVQAVIAGTSASTGS